MTAPDGECEDCIYPEVVIGEADASGPLTSGMHVLTPCPRCGTPPIEELTWAQHTLETTQAALNALVMDRDMLLFHWAPRARRKQIIRFGLRPSMRPTTNACDGYVAAYTCLGDAPSWAWALSGAQRGSPAGDWDLWQVWASNVTDLQVLPSSSGAAANGIHEVRTYHRIYKRHLWLVGSRAKP